MTRMRSAWSTRRYWLPLAAAVACMLAIALSHVPPLAIYALIVLSLGFCFDAATALWARAGGTGGLNDFRQ